MPSGEPVARVSCPTRERFVRDHLRPRRPVLVTGALDHWPALSKWSFEFLRARAGDLRVDTEVGDCLTQPTQRRQWTLRAYLTALLENRLTGDAPGEVPYLSVFPLLDELPELRADIGPTPWPNRHCFWVAWIGPAGTFSGLHYDRFHGLLAQIRGRKRVVLYGPEQWAWMYPSRKFDSGTAISQVDVRRPDPERWPLFSRARGVEVLLEPGELLYIPRGWPHHVSALEPSISLTCFGRTGRETLVSEPRDRLLRGLHRLGLYRRGNCTCHSALSSRP